MNTTQPAVRKEESQVPTTERTRSRRTFIPRVDIHETPDAILVLADMPGVGEDTIDITLEKSVLTLNGSVKGEAGASGTLALSEYAVGDYQRSFTLPSEIDQTAIEATARNGVLKIVLPKSKTAQARKIAVRSAA